MRSDLQLLSDWVESNGGPLVLATLDGARVWQGGFWEDESSHYRAACDITEWTGRVVVEGHQFAVLSGEPLPTIAAYCDESPLLIRGLYAESDEELIDAAADWARQFDPKVAPTCGVEFACQPGMFVLFDSAYAGTGDHKGATVMIERSTGSIRTYLVKANEQTAFLVDWIA